MLLQFCLYKSSEPNKIIQDGYLKFIIKNDDDLIRIDDIIINMLGDYIDTIPEIKKYGIAYIGREEIVDMTITDEDNINMSEEAFRQYMSNVLPKLTIIWNKTVNSIDAKDNMVNPKSRNKSKENLHE